MIMSTYKRDNTLQDSMCILSHLKINIKNKQEFLTAFCVLQNSIMAEIKLSHDVPSINHQATREKAPSEAPHKLPRGQDTPESGARPQSSANSFFFFLIFKKPSKGKLPSQNGFSLPTHQL